MCRDEVLMANGVNVHHDRIAALLEATGRSEWSTSDVRILAGNGQHVPSVGMVLLWSLVSTVSIMLLMFDPGVSSCYNKAMHTDTHTHTRAYIHTRHSLGLARRSHFEFIFYYPHPKICIT